LKNPQEFEERGVKMPRGTLFVGPPGEGKTLLARAVAGEAGVPFFSVAGSEFTNKYVGVGADRVREVFEQAKLNAPSIVFIDEIDSIGQKRSTSPEGGDSERNTTLNQLLVEMDGFDGESRVVVLAATNRPDILDEALLRPGRFDRQATFYKPDYADRLPLLQYYFRDKMLACDVDLDHFAHNTAGFSAASIANIANEAALLAARQKVLMITAKHVDDAITRVLIGAERKTRLMSEREKLNVAVHEAGHAVTYHVASSGEPIARITIMPRGDSGGHVQTMNNDRFLMTDKEILVQICMALGGRAAQQMILGVTDTGASSDFQQARRLAYMFVAEYGMSDLGPLTSVQGVERSPEEKRLIETQVQKILQECEQWAQRIIRDNRTNFDRLVEILLVRETILGPEFAAILAGQSVPDVDTGNFLTADGVAALPFSETPVADDVVDGSADEKTGRTSLGVVGKVIGGVLGSTRARLPHLRRTKNEEQVAAAA
jgi:cell division protease FtsH